MIIKFTTTDGRTFETTDKNVLFAAAGNGLITPDTVFECNGQTMRASQIKGMEFGTAKTPAAPAAPAAPATPESQKNVLPEKIIFALDHLRGLSFACAGLAAVAGALLFLKSLGGEEQYVRYVGHVKTPANPIGIGTGVGMMIGAVISGYMSHCFLDILEYIAKAVTKKDDK